MLVPRARSVDTSEAVEEEVEEEEDKADVMEVVEDEEDEEDEDAENGDACAGVGAEVDDVGIKFEEGSV